MASNKDDIRELTPAETDEFMAEAYVSALELDLADAQALIASYELKLMGANDYIKAMEYLAQEREAKMLMLDKTLDKLETELYKLRNLKR